MVKYPGWDFSQDREPRKNTRSQQNMAGSTNESMLDHAGKEQSSVNGISCLAPVSCWGGVCLAIDVNLAIV